MARIRYLKPDFFKDEDLAELPFEVRLCFAGLWIFADKEGRLEDRPKRLKAEIFPFDNVDMEQCLESLNKIKNGSNRAFIRRYEIEGEKYIQIVNWHKHQKPHHTEKASEIPEPLKFSPTPPIEKGMEKINQLEASMELSNGYLTVKNRKSLKDKEFKPALPDFIDSSLFEAFLEMRIKIKKPMTNKAANLIISRLTGFFDQGQDPNEILKLSIENSYQGVFPLKKPQSQDWRNK